MGMHFLQGRRPSARRTGVAAALLITLGSALAAEGGRESGLHPYVAAGLDQESNLLRQPDLPGADHRGDSYRTLEAGIDGEIELSRQRIELNGRIYEIDYDTFSRLDHTGGDAGITWHWVAGRAWEGELGYRFDRRLRDLGYQDLPRKDLRDRHTLLAGVRRWLSERWRAELGGEWREVEFSESERLDKEVASGSAAADYVSAAGNSAGIEARYLVARFRESEDRDFELLLVGPRLEWSSGKLSIRAQAAWLQRSEEGGGDQDYAGPTGRIVATWQATGKSALTLTLWHDLTNEEDQVANYAVVNGVQLSPTWNITEKSALRLEAGYQELDFEGGAAGSELAPARSDRLATLGLWFDWHPAERIRLSLGGRWEQRDSSDPLEEYENEWVQLRVSVGF